MGAKETLNTLQSLYERHKLATYPRTDSNYLTDDMTDTFKERLQALLATEYKDQVRPLVNRSSVRKCISLIIKGLRSPCGYSYRDSSRYECIKPA